MTDVASSLAKARTHLAAAGGPAIVAEPRDPDEIEREDNGKFAPGGGGSGGGGGSKDSGPGKGEPGAKPDGKNGRDTVYTSQAKADASDKALTAIQKERTKDIATQNEWRDSGKTPPKADADKVAARLDKSADANRKAQDALKADIKAAPTKETHAALRDVYVKHFKTDEGTAKFEAPKGGTFGKK